MAIHRKCVSLIATLGIAPMVGCMQPTEAELAEMMRQPPRPAALDRLDRMIGTWEDSAEITMFGKTTTSQGRSASHWAADEWVFIEEFEHDMGEGNMEKGVMMIWWDDHSQKYRIASATNHGSSGTGTVTYDDKTDKFVWKMKERTHDGHSMTAQGTSKLIGEDAHEWEWSISAPLMGTVMDARGTARRKR